jgi:phage shock protein A
MGVWQRTKTLFQAKANSALNKAEDPRQVLDLSYEQQLENLTKVRRAVADVATARKRLELQAQQIKTQADKLAQQAKAALAQGNEELAREALTRREALAGQLADLDAQHAGVVDQEEKLTATAQTLQTEIEAFRTKKETLKATYTAAEAQTHVSEAISGISGSMTDAGAALQRAQDKVSEMQARSGALDELLSSGALTRSHELTRRHPGPARQGQRPEQRRRPASLTQGRTGPGNQRRARRRDEVGLVATNKFETDRGLNLAHVLDGLLPGRPLRRHHRGPHCARRVDGSGVDHRTWLDLRSVLVLRPDRDVLDERARGLRGRGARTARHGRSPLPAGRHAQAPRRSLLE